MKAFKCFTLVICFFFYLSSGFAIGLPSSPPPKEINNIQLLKTDLPSNAEYGTKNTQNHPLVAGWYSVSGNDFVQGLAENWRVGDSRFSFKYGYFSTPSESQYGAQSVIESTLGAGADPVTRQNNQTPSGLIVGDATFFWATDMEKQYGKFKTSIKGGNFENEIVCLAFSKDKFAVLISAGKNTSDGVKVDLALLERLGQKVETKIDVAIMLGQIGPELPNLITQQGIRNSLQVKLDHFIRNYQQGDYKVALTNITSFINELNAQRGKHVSESAYQTLMGHAATLIQTLNALMAK